MECHVFLLCIGFSGWMMFCQRLQGLQWIWEEIHGGLKMNTASNFLLVNMNLCYLFGRTDCPWRGDPRLIEYIDEYLKDKLRISERGLTSRSFCWLSFVIENKRK